MSLHSVVFILFDTLGVEEASQLYVIIVIIAKTVLKNTGFSYILQK